MARGRGRERSAAAKKLRGRVDRWRRTRTGRSRMPEELWASAVRLARRHGVYRVSQDVGISYASLKTRLKGSAKVPSSRPRKRSGGRESAKKEGPSFVELRAAPESVAAMSAPAAGVVVEVQEAGGARLHLRLGSEAKLDVCAVVRAFRGEGRRRRRRR